MSVLVANPSATTRDLATALHCMLGPLVAIVEDQVQATERVVGDRAWLPLYALRDCLALSEELWRRCDTPGADA